MKIKMMSTLLDWFPERSDIPDAIRISVPMIITLLVFGAFGQLYAGVSGLITAWLIGVQGRNLCYVKRAYFLGISVLLCVVATFIALIIQYSLIGGSLSLCLFALLYGLASNQRHHIRMFSYNFGFTLIIAMHFFHIGHTLWPILLATLCGGIGAMVTALIFWPFSEGRIGVKLLANTRSILSDWIFELSEQAVTDKIHQGKARNAFNDSLSSLVYWYRSTSSRKKATSLVPEIKQLLTLSKYLSCLERQILALPNSEDSEVLKSWLVLTAKAMKAGGKFPVLDVPYKGNDPQRLLIEETQRDMIMAMNQSEDTDHETWTDHEISKIWPRDREAFVRDLKSALSWHSREWHHAVRISATLALTQFIAFYYQVPQGYWITLTAFIVLLTSPIGVTSYRIRYRFYGTILGAPIAFLLIYALPADYLIALTCVFTFIAFATAYKARYEVHVLWITVMIIFAIAILTPNDIYIAVYRLIDTLIGVGIAYLANFLIFPSWTRHWLDAHVLRLLKAERNLLNVMCQESEQFNYSHWQVMHQHRILSQEIAYFAVEPNLSKRDLQDWQTLLCILRQLHDSLLVVMKTDNIHVLQQHHVVWEQVLTDVIDYFPTRYDMGAQSLLGFDKQRMSLSLCFSQEDLWQLNQWMQHQKPYVLNVSIKITS